MSLVDALLELDDQPELQGLRFETDGLLLWPFVRWNVFSRLFERGLGWQRAHASHERRTPRQVLTHLARSAVLHPLRHPRQFDLIVFGTSAGIVLQRDGRWFDRINDYFAAEFPEQTLVVDSAFRGNYKHPRYPPHVRCLDGFHLVGALAGRLGRPGARDAATIERLVTLLRERSPAPFLPSELDATRTELLRLSSRLRASRPLYGRLFEHARPRIVFLENGCYGALSDVLAWARDAGALTAEFQHGLFSPAHLGYNYGPGLRANPDLARQLPQCLLIYGSYWESQVRVPSRTVVVGCPHMTIRSEWLQRTPPCRPRVLVISEGICTERMVSLTEVLATRFPSQRFLFRPHPGEVPFRDRYERLARFSNVEISDRGDLWECFRGATAVVGHSSTGLVEAASLGVPLLVADSETSRLFLPAGLGTRFETPEELVALLERDEAPSYDPGGYWAVRWQERYRAFVDEIRGGG